METVVQKMPAVAPADKVHLQRFSVQYEYEVHFTRHLFAPDNEALVKALCRGDSLTGIGDRKRVGVLLEEGVDQAQPRLRALIERYFESQKDSLQLVGLALAPGGEPAKNNPSEVERLQRLLLDWHLDRHAYVVTIGGGAFLDLTGFAAATFHRGIRCVRVPTTVLAQNDSGVGVKNGINAFGLKNLVGTFAPPFAVINDTAMLSTLSERDRIAGMAEAVKVALIRDATFFRWIESHALRLRAGDEEALDKLNQRCAELHMIQISGGGDPFERGSARPLDYGHWSAHKLESLSRNAIRHGEAVAIGLLLDTRYSVEIGMLDLGEDERLWQLLHALGFTLWSDLLIDNDDRGDPILFKGLEEFREHLGGRLTITLLESIGRGVEVHAIDQAAMGRALAWMQDRWERRA